MKSLASSMRFLVAALAVLMPLNAVGQSVTTQIISKNLSHRVVLLDTVETRLKLIIGFDVNGTLPSGPSGTVVLATLSHGGSVVSSYTIPRLDHRGGNLVFYMPFNIDPGDYDLHIELKDIVSNNVVGTSDHLVGNIEDLCAREGGNCHWMDAVDVPLANPADETLGAAPTQEDQQRGYILWHRDPFRYVYPNSAPDAPEVVSEVAIRMAQAEYEPATFALYALQDLGNVTVGVSGLVDGAGNTLDAPDLRVVKTVPRLTTSSADAYEMKPRLLAAGGSATVDSGRAQRFWLTLHAPQGSEPGTYTGTITITTSMGSAQVPLNVEVLPFALTERPDKEYGLMMTYAFQEMTAQDLTDQQRSKVYDNGVKLYQSFRDHGLTMVFPHSPFVFKRLSDGSPDLRDLEAALQAYQQVGFTGPFIYYCGHLEQTSKPQWAGSSLGYDAAYHPALMQEIVTYARANFSEMESVDFYWMPGDEIHDDRGGPDRQAITADLLNVLWSMGEKTTVTAREQLDWPLDIMFTKPGWGDQHPLNGEPWHFPNSQSVNTNPPDDARKIRREFGLKHVGSEYVGISPWTFQTSQNAGGDPYTDLDSDRGSPEKMLAYPGPDGPIPTPEFEVLREAIDDGKYGYVLENRISSALSSGDPELEQAAQQAQTAYMQILLASDDPGLDEMAGFRDEIIGWILLLEQDSGGPSPPGAPQNLKVE